MTGFTETVAATAGDGSVTLIWSTETVLSSLSPTSGRAGTSVTILGEGFTGATAVLFGDVEAAYTIVSDTEIQATAPRQPPRLNRAPQGLGDAVPVVVVGPAETSNALSFTYLGGGGPGPCDPLVRVCAPASGQQAPTLLGPGSGGGDGSAVGPSQMPDLRGRLRATWDGSTLTVRLRVLITRPKLARPFDVEIRGQDFTRTVRVHPRGRTSVVVRLTIPLSTRPTGRVTARIDPGDGVTESRERNNTASARIRG